MNETVFKGILGESLRREFAEFDNVPEHKFSLGHRLAMRRVFAKYEKNARGFSKIEYTEAMPYYGFKQRVIFALVIIILMTLLTGWFIPIRGITDVQIDWLRSRYDFSTMNMKHTIFNDPKKGVGMYKETDEYGNFLADLIELGIYSEDEVFDLKYRPMPLDTRSDNLPLQSKTKHHIEAIPFNLDDGSPLDYFRVYVSNLEERIGFYIERSKDPARAVEGDVEFAELIKNEYWVLNNGFLELLEKLFADEPDDENGSENEKSTLSHFDKDDKKYLLKTNKL